MAITLNGTTGVTTTGLTSNGIDDNATSTAMTLNSSGNVGIGITNPGVELDVGGNIRVKRNGDAKLYLNNGTTQHSIENISGAIVFKEDAVEAMRIDSSGNVMVGTTDAVVQTNSGTGNGGIVLRSNNYVAVASDGSAALELNRLASDGEIANFRKDGSTAGSIGAIGGDIYVGTGDTTLRFYDAGNAITPRGTNGAGNNGVIDLGGSSERFRNLYLSGGVYLGGTGSANHLDDYEEGAWTPSFYDGITSLTYAIQRGRYTKVGRFVVCDFYILCSGTGTGAQIGIEGLPFAISSGTSYVQGGGLSTYESITNNTVQLYGQKGFTKFTGYINGSTSYTKSSSFTGKYIIGTFQYIT